MSRPLSNDPSSAPYRADQIRSGDPYELSNGRLIRCMTTGGRGSRANLVGGTVLDSDPAVEETGVDTGYSSDEHHLRAPDVAVGNVPDEAGWVKGAPPLAVEYADTGQDEKELREQISELLAAGTRIIWVVRLSGPRRVEIHERGEKTRTALPGEELSAPGILHNPVAVEALYDREAAHEATLRNLLQRRGYRDLEDVRSKSAEEGQRAGMARVLLQLLEKKLAPLPEEARERVHAADHEQLEAWVAKVLDAETLDDVFG